MTSLTSTTTFSRGDVVIVRWPNKHTDIVKARPAIVIQSDSFEVDDETIILVPITSDLTLPLLGSRLLVLTGSVEHLALNTRTDCLILPEKIRHVPVARIGRLIGRCPVTLMLGVDRSLRFVLGL